MNGYPDMSEIDLRQSSFRDNLFPWLIVHHFLPANLVQELCSAVVSLASNGEISLETLVDSNLTPGISSLGNWGVGLHASRDPLRSYLKRFIQSLMWQNDQVAGFHDPEGKLSQYAMLSKLEVCLDFARTDINTYSQLLARPAHRLPEELRPFTEALSKARAAAGGNTLVVLDEFHLVSESAKESPLNALLTKHLGDLFGDLDEWKVAGELYRRAITQLHCCANDSWSDLCSALGVIFKQSLASALLVTEGPSEAIAVLKELVDAGDVDRHVLVTMNTLPDYMAAHFALDKPELLDDERGTALLAPQLVNSHHDASALALWREKKFDRAHVAFWAVLRRQLALGSATYSAETKARLGHAVIDAVAHSLEKSTDRLSFNLGVRLLIESGRHAILDYINWKRELLQRYVTSETISNAIGVSRNAPGLATPRTMALISMFAGWLRELPVEQEDLAAKMIEYLASAVSSGAQRLLSDRDVQRAGLKALCKVGKDRIEFCEIGAPSISAAVCSALATQVPLLATDAMETAIVYLDGFDSSALSDVVSAVIDFTQSLGRGYDHSHFVNPALQLLGSESVARKGKLGAGLYERAMKELVRLSLDWESASINIMYIFRWLDPQFIRGVEGSARMDEIVRKLIDRSSHINSSDAVANIHALLVAPRIAGLEGITAAIAALKAILETASSGKPAISFTDAFHPLILLSNSKEDLASDLALDPSSADELLRPLIPLLLEVWRVAAENPLIFAGFALPRRTHPNGTLVHNWTFATMAFGRAMSVLPDMRDAVAIAEGNPDLQRAISVAKSVRIGAGDPDDFNEEAILRAGSDAFYAALGSRLVVARRLPKDERVAKLSALIRGCFRFGPDGMDCGVLLAALDYELKLDAGSVDAQAYEKRLQDKRDLRMSLFPILKELLPDEPLNYS